MIVWLVAVVAGEQFLSLLLPKQFGAPQAAFQDAIENGTAFVPYGLHLVLHVALAVIACLMAGFVAAKVSNHIKYAPITLGCVLLCIGLLKAGLTWQLVPVWYHVAFTGLLMPVTFVGAAILPAEKQRESV